MSKFGGAVHGDLRTECVFAGEALVAAAARRVQVAETDVVASILFQKENYWLVKLDGFGWGLGDARKSGSRTF